jgi:hypothetical protein
LVVGCHLLLAEALKLIVEVLWDVQRILLVLLCIVNMCHSAFPALFESLGKTLASWSPCYLGVNGSILADWGLSRIIWGDNVLPGLSSDLISNTEPLIFSLNITVF